MAETKPTVFIVDDNEGICNALGVLICSVGIEAKAFSTGSDFLKSYKPFQPGCLVLDVRLPEMSGFQVFEIMKERQYTLPTIFITGYGSVRAAVRAMKMGAMHFLEKPFDDQELLELVQAGIAEDREARAKHEEMRRMAERYSQLSQREREILDRLIQWKNNKTIALELGISHKTVEFHRTNIVRKMETNSMGELLVQMGQLREWAGLTLTQA